jgi:uncharacterized glyoxalase superfamily protein PhnB
MSARTQMSEVDVRLDPSTAFAVFTDEIDYWWLRGPINNWDSARVREMRCEPGVGGRLLEIYDEEAGEMLELARIVAWEPGTRLAWQSSLDDVRIEVLFEPISDGTRVRVNASLPAGGKDAGGTSFVRVTPTWYGRWCARRDRMPHAVQETGQLGVAIEYADPQGAARWLQETFGFEPVLELKPDQQDVQGWIEFRIGTSPLMIFKRESTDDTSLPSRQVPWVFVHDLEAHHATAQSGGATIVQGIQQHGYRAYVAEDLEGNRWTFAQARPTM